MEWPNGCSNYYNICSLQVSGCNYGFPPSQMRIRSIKKKKWDAPKIMRRDLLFPSCHRKMGSAFCCTLLTFKSIYVCSLLIFCREVDSKWACMMNTCCYTACGCGPKEHMIMIEPGRSSNILVFGSNLGHRFFNNKVSWSMIVPFRFSIP